MENKKYGFGTLVRSIFSKEKESRTQNAVMPADGNRMQLFTSFMDSNRYEQDRPKVGIFWYSPQVNEVFGVVCADAKVQASIEYRSAVSCRDSAEYVWSRCHQRGVEQLFMGEYAAMPRGRVFYLLDEDEYDIMVGSWIDSHPEAVEKIKAAFNLTSGTLNVKVMTGPEWETSSDR